MQLPLKSLWVFEAVARCGSFRIAAEELCVSQSADSHQIRHLEEWFGKPLFDRTGNRTQLLPDGNVLAQELRASFQDVDAACQRVRHDDPHAGYRSYSLYRCLLANPPPERISFLVPGHSNSRCLCDSWTENLFWQC